METCEPAFQFANEGDGFSIPMEQKRKERIAQNEIHRIIFVVRSKVGIGKNIRYLDDLALVIGRSRVENLTRDK